MQSCICSGQERRTALQQGITCFLGTVTMSWSMQILPLAAAFVGYIVFWNLSLQLNSVGFYQLSKILIAPAIILIEAVWFKKVPTRLELAAVALLCIGVTLATVSDSEVCTHTMRTSSACCTMRS